MPDRSFYLTKAKELCKAFSNGSSPTTISSFFTTEGIVYEHGPNNISTLPFLGKEFKGVKSIIEYFEMIGKYLKITDEMMFNDWTIDLFPEDVDVEKVKAVITTRGKATFEYTSTGKSWKEQFYYRLELDKDGYISRYEVWADPLSAYLASQA